jgi:arsenate reductase
MNIQIFGKSKCFDTKKAERYFKERRIKYQLIDILKYGISRGELLSVVNAIGMDSVIDEKAKGAEVLKYIGYEEDRFDKLLDNPEYIKTPVVRNGRKATVGYHPEIWETWD